MTTLRRLLMVHASKGSSGDVNLFDITKVEGKSGITVDGTEFSGTAAKIHSIGTVELTSAIPVGTTVTVSCTLRNEGNASTDGSGLSVFLNYSDETTDRMFYAENADTTAKDFTNTFTTEKEIIGISFSYYAKQGNIWHVADLTVKGA